MQILFVEDDPMNRRVVRDMLEVVGAEMAEAPDAETGLRMAAEANYSVILMDIRMPGMDGLTAVKRLREGGNWNTEVPIVIVTADTAADLKARCLASGADEVIQKPVAMNILIDVLGRMLTKQQGAVLF